jgi:hypothetical protein
MASSSKVAEEEAAAAAAGEEREEREGRQVWSPRLVTVTSKTSSKTSRKASSKASSKAKTSRTPRSAQREGGGARGGGGSRSEGGAAAAARAEMERYADKNLGAALALAGGEHKAPSGGADREAPRTERKVLSLIRMRMLPRTYAYATAYAT